jgi:hypothetical protein
VTWRGPRTTDLLADDDVGKLEHIRALADATQFEEFPPSPAAQCH